MKIELPQHTEKRATQFTNNLRTLTIIGANGAGKSRFGDNIARRYSDSVFCISPLKALFINPSNNEAIGNNITRLYNELQAKTTYRIEAIDTEFERLMYLLMYEEFVNVIAYKQDDNKHKELPRTKLDLVQKHWESIFPQNKMLRMSGKLSIVGEKDTKPYAPTRLSDGEKTVLYLLSSVLYAEPNNIIMVEDPEVFLHHSIMKSVWDTVEQLRPDCTFIYLTHDLEFAASRNESTCVWVKSYEAEQQSWDYEILSSPNELPEDVYLDLLGSRKPILFIEGTDNRSIDVRIYTPLYPEYTVKPLGGCSKVIETTRTFNDLKSFHHIESHGIVDRDRRTRREIETLRQRNIAVPDVAEIENLLLIEPVIRTVARRMGLNANNTFDTVRTNIINMFANELEQQALLHTRHRTKREIECFIDRRSHNIDDYEEHIRTITAECNPRKLYSELCEKFGLYVAERRYMKILQVYNQKSMLPNCGIVQMCGFANKEKYIKYILSILR
ncbi:MAG: DUF4435 domain-containing protein, partial [Bacteroidales bacterium]|nr:DUF4435 domain-containing protein [Bacteroidales bacterium]